MLVIPETMPRSEMKLEKEIAAALADGHAYVVLPIEVAVAIMEHLQNEVV